MRFVGKSDCFNNWVDGSVNVERVSRIHLELAIIVTGDKEAVLSISRGFKVSLEVVAEIVVASTKSFEGSVSAGFAVVGRPISELIPANFVI